MTYYSGKDVAYVLIDGVNVAADLDTVRMKTAAVTQEFRALGTTFPQALDTGARNGELEMSGLYEGATTAALLNTVGTNRVASVLLEGNTVSKRFYGFQSAAVESGEVGIASEQMHSNAGVFRVNGAVNFGYVVAPIAARTSASNTQATYADMGASSTTCRAYLAVTALTLGGYDNIIVTVQSCATSGGSYDDETAFAAMTGVGGQSVALASTVNRYLAVKWAWTGSGTGNSATFFVGVAPS